MHYNAGIKRLRYEGFVSIRREWVSWHVDDKNLYRFDYNPRARFPASITMARAQQRMQEARYNPFKNNCEHFARWCTTGQKRSVQMERIPLRLKKNIGRLAGTLFTRLKRDDGEPECDCTSGCVEERSENVVMKSAWYARIDCHSLVRSSVHPFFRSLGCSFTRSFVRSSVRSFIHQFVVCSYNCTVSRV